MVDSVHKEDGGWCFGVYGPDYGGLAEIMVVGACLCKAVSWHWHACTLTT